MIVKFCYNTGKYNEPLLAARDYLVKLHPNEENLRPLWKNHFDITVVKENDDVENLTFRDEEHFTAFLLRWS